MRNVLSYYYNLSFDKITEYKEYSILECNAEVYVFKKSIQDIELTKKIVTYLESNNILTHKIIFNKEGEIETQYKNEKYVLLKLNKITDELDDNFFVLPVNGETINVASLWEEKINYYMRQISELSLGKELLIDSFNYYIGMAENAIAMYNRAYKADLPCSVCHRRIRYPNYAINYLDPTNMLIDVRVRDLAEYIKSRFFYGEITANDVEKYIIKNRFMNEEINILYARLFYPTYYFDLFEDVIVDTEDEQVLKKF